MSLELLGLYEKADIPDLKPLARHLLQHYCNKHIDDLGKAFPSSKELERITHAHEKSIIRAREQLVKAGALVKVTAGYPGQVAEFAVQRDFLIKYQQVTDGLPISRNKKTLKGYQQVTQERSASNPVVTERSPTGYPIQENKINNKQQFDDESYFSELIPPDKQFTFNSKTQELIKQIKEKLDSHYDLRRDVKHEIIKVDWAKATNPQALFQHILAKMLNQRPAPKLSSEDKYEPLPTRDPRTFEEGIKEVRKRLEEGMKRESIETDLQTLKNP